MIPSQVDDLDATISKLRELADIHDREVQRFQQRGQSSKFETTPLKIDLSEETIARVAVQLHQLPSVYLEAYAARRYTYGESTAHVLGHLASISKKDRERIDLYRYRGTRRIGRAGIEHQYESLLLGTPGLQQAEVNAQGRSLMVHDRKAPTPGSNLVLTLDADLQRVASDAMAGLEGAIVAIEPSTGDILALVSTPSFDPDVFGHSIDPGDYRNLIRDAKNPLLNRAIQGQYAPGSTIKPFVALAGLESGHAIPEKQFFAAPQFKIPNYRRPFRDWKDEGHGWVTVSSSITQSCDVYFYSLAYRMGIEALEPFLAQFGLGQTQQLDLPGERPGLLPNETWKQKMYGQPWYPGETVIMGIGQGYLLLTPLQLATATAALATRGIRMKPRLLRAYEQDGEIIENPPEELGRVTLSNPAWWDLVTNAMVDVVHAENGTARRSGLDATYRIAGKTGTAQVINYGEKRPDSEDLPEHIRRPFPVHRFRPRRNTGNRPCGHCRARGPRLHHGRAHCPPSPGRLSPESPVMAQHFYTSAVSRLVEPLDRTLMALLLAVLALSLTIQYSANDMSLQATQQHAIRIGIGLLALLGHGAHYPAAPEAMGPCPVPA